MDTIALAVPGRPPEPPRGHGSGGDPTRTTAGSTRDRSMVSCAGRRRFRHLDPGPPVDPATTQWSRQ